MTRLIPSIVLAGAGILTWAGATAAQAAGNPADVGTAVAAQIACAGIFVSGRTEADVLRDDVHALAPFARAVTLSVDRKRRTVAAAAPGATTRTALYRPVVGCTLLTGKTSVAALDGQVARLRPARARADNGVRLTPGAPIRPAAIDRAALDAAVARAFDEQNKDGYPDTRAMLVVQHGAIVAERYAPGFDRDTRLLGWSATKSITAALIGLLVDDGVLQLDAPAPVPEWQGAGDPRAAITLRQLLNMASGLTFNESYEPGSDSLQMLFAASDMAAYAASRPLQHAPGTTWSYSSGTSNILSGIVFRATGGTLEAVTRFARTRLFEPAGMRSALIEPDEAGVPVGSSYGYATARDWARFGQLFLDRGRADGKQILSSGWVDFVRAPTTAAPRPLYGGQFWLNRGDDSGARKRMFADLPTDTFMALGHNEQIVAVIPSLDAVVVRLGWTPEGVDFDSNGYIGAIAAALEPGAAAKRAAVSPQ
ncbi:serine hydrolase domain-containing protein [Sphingomonas colocasiae]|uniref:Beta-lactamase family protein n=1 Tax=Sphingomonas colocasiae TaxID=1848973 RepID=A0ABS7PXB3_9SPHN|nr:serine hydrolase [Sphingomonas colocasiae]MBY8825604.1 beta-lactamase family protein [Sphingomonas colocasiae]